MLCFDYKQPSNLSDLKYMFSLSQATYPSWLGYSCVPLGLRPGPDKQNSHYLEHSQALDMVAERKETHISH